MGENRKNLNVSPFARVRERQKQIPPVGIPFPCGNRSGGLSKISKNLPPARKSYTSSLG